MIQIETLDTEERLVLYDSLEDWLRERCHKLRIILNDVGLLPGTPSSLTVAEVHYERRWKEVSVMFEDAYRGQIDHHTVRIPVEEFGWNEDAFRVWALEKLAERQRAEAEKKALEGQSEVEKRRRQYEALKQEFEGV
jgi:hypothetical protein